MSVYNAELHLRECLDCIADQTLQNIEIVCVNDGSTDGTLQILKDFAARDSRVKIINRPNREGLAVARNEALAFASGKYIGFVDGDDRVDRNAFRKAYECAELNQSDLVIWDYVAFHEESELERNLSTPSSLRFVSSDDKVALLRLPAFAWTRIIRTDVARSLKISFPVGLTRQDIPVHWKLITQIDKISILPERLSFYRQQPSATTHKKDWRLADLALVMDLVRDYLVDHGLYGTYKNVFLLKQLELLRGIVDGIDRSLKPKAMLLVKQRLGDDQWRYILEKGPLRWQTRDFYLGIRGSVYARMRRSLWLFARYCYRSILLFYHF